MACFSSFKETFLTRWIEARTLSARTHGPDDRCGSEGCDPASLCESHLPSRRSNSFPTALSTFIRRLARRRGSGRYLDPPRGTSTDQIDNEQQNNSAEERHTPGRVG